MLPYAKAGDKRVYFLVVDLAEGNNITSSPFSSLAIHLDANLSGLK